MPAVLEDPRAPLHPIGAALPDEIQRSLQRPRVDHDLNQVAVAHRPIGPPASASGET